MIGDTVQLTKHDQWEKPYPCPPSISSDIIMMSSLDTMEKLKRMYKYIVARCGAIVECTNTDVSTCSCDAIIPKTVGKYLMVCEEFITSHCQ